jgi:hypothetical protein
LPEKRTEEGCETGYAQSVESHGGLLTDATGPYKKRDGKGGLINYAAGADDIDIFCYEMQAITLHRTKNPLQSASQIHRPSPAVQHLRDQYQSDILLAFMLSSRSLRATSQGSRYTTPNFISHLYLRHQMQDKVKALHIRPRRSSSLRLL